MWEQNPRLVQIESISRRQNKCELKIECWFWKGTKHCGWLVVSWFNATLTAMVISWQSVTHNYVFPGFLTPFLTQLFFPKPRTTFLTCFCRGERRKYVGEKCHLSWGSNSQPPGHVSDMLTTEPPGRGRKH